MENKTIDLQLVANELNRLMGPSYRFFVNCRTDIATDGITDVVLKAARIPFAVDGIGSETLELTIEVWALANNVQERNRYLRELNALIGHRSGVIEADENTRYRYASYLQFETPSAPEIDMGTWKVLLTLTGTMLLSEQATGALVSNEVMTYVYLGDPSAEDTVQGFIPTLAVQSDMNYATDSTIRGNDGKINLIHQARAAVINVSALILGRELDRKLLARIRGTEGKLNEAIWLKRIYPFDTTEKARKYKIIGGKITEQAGAYAQYALSLQEVD